MNKRGFKVISEQIIILILILIVVAVLVIIVKNKLGAILG